MTKANHISVQLVYVQAPEPIIKSLTLKQGAQVKDAIEQSNLCNDVLLHDSQHLGIYGRTVTLDTDLNDGDRVEIYCDLKISPVEARRRRMLQGHN